MNMVFVNAARKEQKNKRKTQDVVKYLLFVQKVSNPSKKVFVLKAWRKRFK